MMGSYRSDLSSESESKGENERMVTFENILWLTSFEIFGGN